MKVNLEELVAALEGNIGEMEYYLDRHTGEVVIWVDEEITGEEPPEIVEGRHLRIEPLPSWQGYRDMEEFIETVGSEALQDRLSSAIKGRGAFRRFKDALRDHPAERDAWFAFQGGRMRERALAWLSERGIEVEE